MKKRNGFLMVFRYICLSSVVALGLMAIIGAGGGDGDNGGAGDGTSTSYSISDLEGTWYLRSIDTQKDGQPDNFGYDTSTFTFQSDGSFMGAMTDDGGDSWNESGTASVSVDGAASLPPFRDSIG